MRIPPVGSKWQIHYYGTIYKDDIYEVTGYDPKEKRVLLSGTLGANQKDMLERFNGEAYNGWEFKRIYDNGWEFKRIYDPIDDLIEAVNPDGA